MKPRSPGFLSEENLPQDGEVFAYIVELHEYLWKFIRAINPGASGSLEDYLDEALAKFIAREEEIEKCVRVLTAHSE